MVLTTDSIGNIFRTSNEQGLGLGANSNMKLYHDEDTIWTNAIKTVALGSGTITLLATTATHDINFADVVVPKDIFGVGDLIIIEVTTINDSTNKPIYLRFDYPGVVSEAIVTAVVGTAAWCTTSLTQSATVSSRLIHRMFNVYSSTAYHKCERPNTSVTNIFSSGFTMRINTRYETQPADADSKLKYIVYAIRSAV